LQQVSTGNLSSWSS